MATQEHILANRSNAKASTGPTSPEPKAASPVLPHESRENFKELEAAYHAEFNPQGPHETFLVGEMIQARWKLARVQPLEAAAFEQIAGPDSRILNALGHSGNVLDKLLHQPISKYHQTAQIGAVTKRTQTRRPALGEPGPPPLKMTMNCQLTTAN